jgi:hypothetical protein
LKDIKNLRPTLRGAKHRSICFKIGYVNVREQKILADDKYRMGEKSPNMHTIRTQNQFKFPQHNACPFHSTFSNEVDAEKIVRAWRATVKAKPHEKRRESEAESPNFRK